MVMIMMLVKCLLLLLVDLITCQDVHEESELRAALLKNYDKDSIPMQNTKVTLRFTVLHFTMNEELQSLDLDLWLSMEWTDPRLSWSKFAADKNKYTRIDELAFRRDTVWHPDVTLYNNALGGEVDIYASSKIVVMMGGKVIWVPPAHAKASCVMDMTYWPHDIHNCTAKFGSWVHHIGTIDIQTKDNAVEFEGISAVGRNISRAAWNVLSTRIIREAVHYSCCPEAYVNVQLRMTLQRNAPAFGWIVQMPCVVLCLLTIVIFLLPPSSGEKVILGGIVLTLDLLFLLAVSQLIRHPDNHTPLIVKLIGQQFILTGVTVIMSAIILRLVRDPHGSGLPVCIRMPMLALSSFLCLRGYRQMISVTATMFPRATNKGEDVELNDGGNGQRLYRSSENGPGTEGDWLLFAAVLDRFCLIIFTFIFLINVFSYASVL